MAIYGLYGQQKFVGAAADKFREKQLSVGAMVVLFVSGHGQHFA